jgi:4-hydroxy-tetrahydrodipicolinate reductase
MEKMEHKKTRVIIYGLGPIGLATARLILTKTSLELVGAVDVSQDLVNRDLGELLKLNRQLGLPVTDNLRTLLPAKRADLVVHTAGSRLQHIYPQLEEILAARLNIVSSAEELLFPGLGPNALWERLHLLALKQKARVLGTGVNPGFVMDALPAYLTSVCQEVRRVQVTRVVDASTRRYPLQKKIGAGMTRELFQAKMEEKAMGHVGLVESAGLLAGACGFTLTEIRETIEPVTAPAPVQTEYFSLMTGDIAGIRNIARGIQNGEERVTLDLQMYIGAPDPHDTVVIEGIPSLKMRIEGGVAGDVATAAILVNSIPALLRAAPGLLTVRDIPPTGLTL